MRDDHGVVVVVNKLVDFGALCLPYTGCETIDLQGCREFGLFKVNV